MTEEQKAVEVEVGDDRELKIGIEISDGPETYRLLLTQPLDKEGLIEEIPVDAIRNIHRVEPGRRGERPEIVDEA